MATRGAIRNREISNQVKDYRGLRYGNITPTDIDGLIDFGNKIFVIIEIKFRGIQLPTGQKLAIERLADAIVDAGKVSLALVATHNVNVDSDIDVANCEVAEIRFNKKWIVMNEGATVIAMIDRLLKKYAPQYLCMESRAARSGDLGDCRIA